MSVCRSNSPRLKSWVKIGAICAWKWKICYCQTTIASTESSNNYIKINIQKPSNFCVIPISIRVSNSSRRRQTRYNRRPSPLLVVIQQLTCACACCGRKVDAIARRDDEVACADRHRAREGGGSGVRERQFRRERPRICGLKKQLSRCVGNLVVLDSRIYRRAGVTEKI